MVNVINTLIVLPTIIVFGVRCCDPAEIGQSYSLLWTGVVTSEQYISWYISDSIITFCTSDTLTCGVISPLFSANITKTQTNAIIIYLNVTSMIAAFYQRRFSIHTNENVYIVCDSLEVFIRSVSANCTSFFETSLYSHVIVSCVSSNVFPRAKMTVGLPNYKASADCQKDTNEQSIIARCVIIIPINYVHLESNISVTIFPNVTQGERYGFQNLFQFPFVLPEVELSYCPTGPDVKDGCIKNGTSASCLCVLSNPGYPPGQAQWYETNNSSLTEVGTNYENGSSRIAVDHNVGVLNFTCKGKSALGMSQKALYFSPKFVYPVEIKLFTANRNTTTLVVPEKAGIVFQCDVSNNTPTTFAIIKRTSNTVINISTVVSCEDSGEYVCQAIDLVFGTMQERSIIVYVQCALHLTNTESERNVFKATDKSDLVIKIEIYGYPPPKSYALFRRETGIGDHFVSNLTAKYNKKYLIDYSIQSLPYGNLYLTIYNVTSVDFTNYTLKIYNGWGNELVYTFSVTEDIKTDSKSTTDVLPAAIGGSVAGAVLVALILLLVIKRTDLRQIKSINCTKRKGNEDKNTVEIPKTPVVTVPQRDQDTGYEEVNLEQNYDILNQIEGETDQSVRYQVNATRQYDEIDLSQVAIERPYDPVTIKEKGSYQNYALSTSHI